MMIRLSNRTDQTTGVSEWLTFVWACNDIESIFGRPIESGDWWAGGSHETYTDVRVIFGTSPDEGVRITSLTDRGKRVMAQAADTLGIYYN
jgi:hypothetical protein